MTASDPRLGPLDPSLDRLIRELPKAELHVHLEGSLRPELALRLAARRGVELPGGEGGVAGLRERYRFANFGQFIELYVALSSCLEQAEDLSEAIVDIAEGLAAQRVCYAEMTFTPMTHVERGVDADALLAGLSEGRRLARERHGVKLAWVFDIVRSLPRQALPTLELALRARDEGVVGLGVGGPEGPQWPVEPLALSFRRAKAEGLRSLPHAGEQDGAASVRAAVEFLAADRIGHGVRCLEDPELVALIRGRGIALEVCPSSNVALGVAPSLAEHPLPALLRAGLELSLASDDPPLFGTSLVEEYRRCAAAFGWGADDVIALATAAVEHSCLDEADKHQLWEEQDRVVRALTA